MDLTNMQRLVARIERELLRAWVGWVEHVKEANSEEEIATRLRVVDEGSLLRGLTAAAASFAAVEHQALALAGQSAARWLEDQVTKHAGRSVAKKLLHFDAADPIAVQWAERNRLDLIREIQTEQRILIRDALIGAAQSGENPRVTARAIRESVGLTQAQERAVQGYRANLERGQLAAAMSRELSSGVSDRTIAAAQRAGTELSAAQIGKMVDRYRANFVALRAETIARTEAARIAHQGTEELYRQAIERGELQAEQLERTWHHSPGAKLKNARTFHRSMGGQTRAWGELFQSGLGGLLRYPCDPEASAEETVNCRCCVTVRVRAPAADGAQGGRGGRAAEREVAVADEAALEEEAVAAEEEAAVVEQEIAEAEAANAEAALAEEEALAAEQELAADLDSEPWFGPDDHLGSPQPSSAQQQRLQQSAQRLERLRAELAQAEEAHAEMESGFRIGVSSEIAGETEIDEVEWLREHQAAAARARRPGAVAEPIGRTPAEQPGDPYRTPGAGPRDTVTPSEAIAPVGYESVEYNGALYYRHRITGRSYTPAQYAERSGLSKDGYGIELTGPNEQIPGFRTWEIQSSSTTEPQIRYRTVDGSGQAYTREQVLSGEAAETEAWIKAAEAKEAERPGFLRRIGGWLTGPGRMR